MNTEALRKPYDTETLRRSITKASEFNRMFGDDCRFSVGVFTLFIVLETAALVCQNESGTGNDGNKEVGYNISAAWFCIEAIKFFAAGILWRAGACANVREVNKETIGEIQNEESSSWLTWWQYGLPSALYAIANNAGAISIIFLGAPFYLLLSNIRIIFAAICNRVFLGQKIQSMQWFAVLVLMASIMVGKLDVIMVLSQRASDAEQKADSLGSFLEEMPKIEENGRALTKITTLENVPGISWLQQSSGLSTKFIIGCGLCAANALACATASTSMEHLLKVTDPNVPAMRKNMFMYQWGMLFNAVLVIGTEANQRFGFYGPVEPAHGLLNGFTLVVLLMIISNAAYGIATGLVLQYFDNILKSFARVAVIFLTLVAAVYMGRHTPICLWVGVVLFLQSTLLYGNFRAEPPAKEESCRGDSPHDEGQGEDVESPTTDEWEDDEGENKTQL